MTCACAIDVDFKCDISLWKKTQLEVISYNCWYYNYRMSFKFSLNNTKYFYDMLDKIDVHYNWVKLEAHVLRYIDTLRT